MKKLSVLLGALLLSVAACGVHAADASLSMVYTNALGDELPFSIFSKHSWAPDPKARFVKLHMYFDDPIMVQGLSVDTCGGEFKRNFSVFINFDQWVQLATSVIGGETPKTLYPEKEGGLYTIKDLDAPIELRSLTINFEDNTGFKICGINLKSPQGEIYKIRTPEVVKGRVTASSTLAPSSAYDAIYLFDSRFEYGWASNKQAKDVDLSFSFDEPQRVEKIRLWNGYQRSAMHCVSNSRAKQIRITGDGGYDEQITVKDTLGSQVILLPKPFEGKNLKFTVVDSFRGRSYPDLVISELRFYDGSKGWFMLDPSARLKENIAANRAQFEKAHVLALMNDSFIAQPGDAGEFEEASGWASSTLRLRADGSFYVAGDSEAGEATYFALGNYEIKEADKDKGLKIRVFGLYYEKQEPHYEGDCNGCGRDCNKLDSPDDDGGKQKIFQEIFVIRSTKDGKFEVVNQNGGKSLQFKRLKFSRES